MDKLDKNSNALISFAAVVVIIYGMQAAKVLLVPFLLAVFFALVTVRPMLWMQKHRVPSVIAALLIVIAMMLIIGLAGSIVGTSIESRRARRAETASRAAEADALARYRTSQAVVDFLLDTFEFSDPRESSDTSITADEILDQMRSLEA